MEDIVHSDLAQAHTPPSSAYLSPEIFEREKKEIFRKSWHFAGCAEKVREPGQFLTLEIAGEPVVVIRGKDNVLRAFSNVCRHRGSILLQGSGKVSGVQCPYHAWTYNLEGKLQGAPEFQGVKNWEKESVGLPQFRAETWGPLVFVHLGEDPLPLQEILAKIPSEIEQRGYPFSQYRFLTRTEYEIKCNWKVYVDNYLEGYHLPAVHPGLFRELDYSQYRVDTFDWYSSQYAPLRKDARRYAPSGPEPLYYWIFPNLMLNIYPDNLHSHVVLPLAADRTLVIFDWFQAPDSTKSLEETISFSDQVQKEDMLICERVQKGLASPHYHRGRYSVARENGVHHFHRLWQSALTPP